jgi:hypothetical protein
MQHVISDAQPVDQTIRTVYLDILALLHDSSVVELTHPRFDLWVTPSVMTDLNAPKPPDPRSHQTRFLLDRALDEGRVRYNPVDLTNLGLTPGIYAPYEDVLAHAVASRERRGDRAVLVVTEDPNMRQGAESLGLAVTDTAGLRQLVEDAYRADADAAAAARQQARHQRWLILVRVMAGLLLAAVGALVWWKFALIVNTITVWGTLVGVAATGAALYAIRGRFRLVYGVAEVAIGLLTAARVLTPKSNFGSISWGEGFALMAGLYVIVRGLANIGKALEGTPYEETWRRYSGEPGKP